MFLLTCLQDDWFFLLSSLLFILLMSSSKVFFISAVVFLFSNISLWFLEFPSFCLYYPLTLACCQLFFPLEIFEISYMIFQKLFPESYSDTLSLQTFFLTFSVHWVVVLKFSNGVLCKRNWFKQTFMLKWMLISLGVRSCLMFYTAVVPEVWNTLVFLFLFLLLSSASLNRAFILDLF